MYLPTCPSTRSLWHSLTRAQSGCVHAPLLSPPGTRYTTHWNQVLGIGGARRDENEVAGRNHGGRGVAQRNHGSVAWPSLPVDDRGVAEQTKTQVGGVASPTCRRRDVAEEK